MKPLWMGVIAIGLVGMITGVWMESTSSTPVPAPQTSSAALSGAAATSQHANASAMENKFSPQQLQQQIHDRLKQFQQKPGNIYAFLNALQDICPDQTECQNLLKKVLAQYPDQAFAETMLKLVERLPAYEQKMQSTIMSTSMDPKQRYDALWKLREQLLGAKEAALGFSEEHHNADYQFAVNDLMQQAAQMPQQQRLEKLNHLQQQFSIDPQAESQTVQYEQALQLSLVGVNDAAQRQQITRQLRESYFDAAEIAHMEKRDQQLQQQQQQVDQYQQRLSQLKQEMAQSKNQMPEQQWQQLYQQRLEQLRKDAFQ
ncbi:lipase secretion chaperone [Acinetobacter sp. WZC-1]|uniref:lipase secretion chaperone n=1 Tax=Acinetobacter sp. WZC-1 TaxID=3459034 RepID=UPI00403E0501